MFIIGLLSVLWPALNGVWSFNIYAEHPTVYRGPDGSYFGYSVDFYQPTSDSNTFSVLVGAPKANTSQPGIVEAGAVYYCPWPGHPDSCRQIPFDNSNNRMIKVNGTREPLEFKSHQWFGASVRTHKGKVVACAPLYHWRTVKLSGEKDPVGTCYVAVQNFSAYAEYSPCRTNDPDPEGQGFCQAGFSVDFTKVKIAAAIMASYFGYSVAVTDLNGDGTDDVLVGAPLYMEREMESKPREVGRVYLYLQMAPLTFSKPVALTGTHTFGRFGTSIAPLGDINQDGYNDVAVGCPFGGEERGGRVLIFNGNRDVSAQGLTMSQELRAARTPSGSLPGYGFTLRGGQDLDNNQYPGKYSHSAYILLDCGDDNICIPDLQLSATMDRSELVIGDDNLVMLTITAMNRGEGAYETELHTLIPLEADYIGVTRRVESLSQLNCEYKMVNESRMVVCDLGNPMVAGTELSVGLRFSVQRLEDAGPKITVFSLFRVSHPSQVVLPFPHWEPKEKPVKEDDVGPQVTHIYELHNFGPSSIREAELQVGWPSRFRDENLLYAMEIQTDGPISCRTNTSLNPLASHTCTFSQETKPNHSLVCNVFPLSVFSPQNCTNISCLRIMCIVGRLDRGQSAVVKIRSRLWAHTFLQRRNDPYILNSTVSFMVTALPYRIQPSTLPQHTTSVRCRWGPWWYGGTPDVSFAVPLWVIILAILLGLLVLAMLTLAMWKVHTH
uniref:Integrin subunit alpha 8 n=1 Tax=Sander lucioperca TaxID=283035 RepID=A0A8C9XXX4_SANLU